jgi:hypothetical protein
MEDFKMQCSTATETAKDLTTKCPEVQIVTKADPDAHAESLDNVELLNHLKSTFRTIRESLPYLRVARDRFAAPGKRLPVEGQPTWSQWVKMNLHVNIRTVQRWLAPPKEEEAERKPRAKKQRGVRPFVPLRDWPEAQRKANDLLLAVKRLKQVNTVGTDVMFEPMRELAAILGFHLVKK